MKKFKYVFLICLSVLLSIGLYVGKAENFKINIVGSSYISKESTVVDKRIADEESMSLFVLNSDKNIALSVLNDGSNIDFNSITLDNNHDEHIINIKLKNNYLDNKVNTIIDCSANNNNYIDIYADKNLYVIDENSSVSAKIIIKLKHKQIMEDLSINFSCSVTSTSN